MDVQFQPGVCGNTVVSPGTASPASQDACSAELQLLLENVPAVILIAHDPQCQCVTTNRLGYEVLRLPIATNLCQLENGQEQSPYQIHWHGEPTVCGELPLFRAAQYGESFLNEELEIRFADGSSRWLQGNVVPLRDPGGMARGAMGAFVDITERKKVEAYLRRSEERFRTMAETVPDFIFTCRPDGYNDYCNRRFYDYTGLPPGSVTGQVWLEALHPEDRARAKEEWTECLQTGRPIEIQHRIRGADGSYRWFLVRAGPLRDASGTIVQWFGVATDIEAQKHAEEILETTVAQRTAKLQETIAELESYSYSITHDLRAPLRAIHGFAKLLQEKTTSWDIHQRNEQLQHIITSTQRMDRLLQDTLNYGKILRGELTLEPVNVAELLRGIIDSYDNLQPAHAQVIVKGMFPLVMGNKAALTHCCSNLLENAVKFVAPGTFPRVRVWAETRGKWVRLWFADNGIGIPKEAQEKIFTMFHRLDKRLEGTGIGLAIVRKAIDRMGGKAGVESEPGHGSRFWLDLPSANQGAGGGEHAQFCHSVCRG